MCVLILTLSGHPVAARNHRSQLCIGPLESTFVMTQMLSGAMSELHAKTTSPEGTFGQSALSESQKIRRVRLNSRKSWFVLFLAEFSLVGLRI